MGVYNPQIEVYTAAGILDASVWMDGLITNRSGFRFVLGSTGGCLGGELRLGYTRAIEAAFQIAKGQWIKAYHSVGDLVYEAEVIGARRNLGSMEHEYELRGRWERLRAATFSEPTNFGALSSQNPTLSTCGLIVKYIVQTYGEDYGIVYDASLIDSDVAVAEIETREGHVIQDLLVKLAYEASSVGVPVFCGVRADGKFYFHVPLTTPARSLTKGINVFSAEESAAGVRDSKKIILKGDVDRTTGYFYKRSFIKPGETFPGRPRLIKLAGFKTRADFNNFAAGYWVRHAQAQAQVAGLSSVTAIASMGLDKPWERKIQYHDPVKGLTIEDYCGSVEVEFDQVCRIQYNLGLSNDRDVETAAGDQYAPSARDAFGGVGNPENLWQDDMQELPEWDDTSEGMVGGPDEDYPHFQTDETGGGPGPGTTTTLLQLHGHQGFYDGGWAGYLTGGF